MNLNNCFFTLLTVTPKISFLILPTSLVTQQLHHHDNLCACCDHPMLGSKGSNPLISKVLFTPTYAALAQCPSYTFNPAPSDMTVPLNSLVLHREWMMLQDPLASWGVYLQYTKVCTRSFLWGHLQKLARIIILQRQGCCSVVVDALMYILVKPIVLVH